MFRLWQLILWLIYFLSPVDAVPDVAFGVGWLDDLLILLMLYWFVWRKSPGKSDPEWWKTVFNEARKAEQATSGSSESASEKKTRQERNRDPFQILGVEHSATFEEIKRAYHAQANRYHPDKVTHLGDEFQKLAHKKFQDIQWAYEQLVKEKGRR